MRWCLPSDVNQWGWSTQQRVNVRQLFCWQCRESASSMSLTPINGSAASLTLCLLRPSALSSSFFCWYTASRLDILTTLCTLQLESPVNDYRKNNVDIWITCLKKMNTCKHNAQVRQVRQNCSQCKMLKLSNPNRTIYVNSKHPNLQIVESDLFASLKYLSLLKYPKYIKSLHETHQDMDTA